jgi:membrane associated rhomboid family serine protease
MFGVTTSDESQPVAWVGRYPLDVTTLLVCSHVAAAVVACLFGALRVSGILSLLMFDSAGVLSGQIWRLATYAFVHPPSTLLWVAIEMYMLFMFGREVERFIGRRAFIFLYALLLLGPSVCLSVWGLSSRTLLAGSSSLHFGVFIAFATIYPNVQMSLLRVPLKWIAAILAAVFSLMLLADNAWSQLAVLWLTVGGAFYFIRLRGIGTELVWWSNLKSHLRPKPPIRVMPKPSSRRVVEPEDVHDSIDPLLDKISKHGIGSLTASERRALDRARARLLKKSQ